jgi:hypothetical protein
MRSRRASRVVAATAALFLAASGLGACLYPRAAAAAKDCCKKRCDHDAKGSIRGCCCATPASPVPSTGRPDAKPVTPSFLMVVTPRSAVVPPAHALAILGAAAPPGCPLFLQRCTLVL